MIDEEEMMDKLRAFYHIYPSMQSRLNELEISVKHLEYERIRLLEEKKHEQTIMKQYIGKIKRIEQFLIENGLIRLLGSKSNKE